MPPADTVLIISFAYLIGKHFLGDFVFQNTYQITNKAHYGHPGGLLHVLIHGALSLPLFALLPNVHISLFALLIAGEMIAHYHIDWAKEWLLHKTGWDCHDKRFWRVFGFDQLLHILSYLVMATLIVTSITS